MLDPAKSQFNTLPITPSPPPGLLLADHFGASFGYHVRRPHGTRDWLITYTLAGEGRYCIDGQIHLCQPGDLFILEPGCPHDYATAQSAAYWEFYWAHFTPRAHWIDWLQLPALAPGLLTQRISAPTLRQRIEQTFIRLLQDSQGIGVWQTDLSANALEEILILIAQQHEWTNSRSLDPRIETVLSVLNQRFRERLTVAELAQTVALSPSRLAHLFKEQVGSTIMEQVISLRLRQAARLLEFTSLTVGEIAHEVGFQSQFHFARQFKNYYGRTPTEYRRQVQTSPVGSVDVAHM
jgi:AraC family transcriptional regulator, arabinose operon regulatory protein